MCIYLKLWTALSDEIQNVGFASSSRNSLSVWTTDLKIPLYLMDKNNIGCVLPIKIRQNTALNNEYSKLIW